MSVSVYYIGERMDARRGGRTEGSRDRVRKSWPSEDAPIERKSLYIRNRAQGIITFEGYEKVTHSNTWTVT